MTETTFQHVRPVDLGALEALDPAERFTQKLIDHESGGRTCSINYIRTPAGGGSPAGLHVHDVDQIFYVIGGTMNIEVAGQEAEVRAGSLVVFPAGVAHRNWNAGEAPTTHLAINVPMPDPDAVFARTVAADGEAGR